MKLQPRYKKGDKIGGRYQVHDVKMGGMGEVCFCLDLEEMILLALKTFQTLSTGLIVLVEESGLRRELKGNNSKELSRTFDKQRGTTK